MQNYNWSFLHKTCGSSGTWKACTTPYPSNYRTWWYYSNNMHWLYNYICPDSQNPQREYMQQYIILYMVIFPMNTGWSGSSPITHPMSLLEHIKYFTILTSYCLECVWLFLWIKVWAYQYNWQYNLDNVRYGKWCTSRKIQIWLIQKYELWLWS